MAINFRLQKKPLYTKIGLNSGLYYIIGISLLSAILLLFSLTFDSFQIKMVLIFFFLISYIY